MRLVILFAIWGVVITHCNAQDNIQHEYELEFVSSSTTFRVQENETIFIPCLLKSMENTSTVWYRNGQKIADTQNTFYETPTNMELQRNHSLKIANVKRLDSGEYSCEIIVAAYRKPMRQNHLVNVLYPPVLYPDPVTGSIDVELGHNFILICDVVGNPPPKIRWYFQNREILVPNEHVVVFNISQTKKDHAGEYQCVADNDVGRPAAAVFQVRVLYHPEVTTERTWLHSAIGIRTEIVCTILANPRPKVDWFHNDVPINASVKVAARVMGDKYFLTIRNMRYNDFGNYTCQGANFLGRNSQTIHISGLPYKATFKQEPRIRSETSYTLIWEVDSNSPIIQYNLRFRRQQRGDVDGRWIELIIPAACINMGPIHSETYTLAGLQPATVYEATISSKNEFGWGELSSVFRFATVGTDVDDGYRILDATQSTVSKSSSNVDTIRDSITDSESEENALWLSDGALICSLQVPVAVLSLFVRILTLC